MPASPKLPLSPNALRVLEARCLRCGAEGDVSESPEEMFARVARSVAAAEATWKEGSEDLWASRFLEAMTALAFLPNSTTLMNAGQPKGLLPACYVLPVESGPESIARTMALADRIHLHGAGTGFCLSSLSEAHPPGPVAFLAEVDAATRALGDRSPRCGANMGVLDAGHPDILAFLRAKRREHVIPTFNLSVAVTDAFMRAQESGGRAADGPSAQVVFKEIAEAAWTNGEPGLLFADAIERANPTPYLGTLRATNPCGEVPLLPYESCVLGSINLPRLLRRDGNGQARLDWRRLDALVRLATRFLDDVIEVTDVPHPEIERATKATRKIGVGVMGLAELLAELGIPYASPTATGLAERIMRRVAEAATDASRRLAEVRGPFGAQADARPNYRQLRNATRTSIAPTGTLSVIAGTTPGIEPFFGLAWRREGVLGGQCLVRVEPTLCRWLGTRGLDGPATMDFVREHGRLPADVPELAEARSLFPTAAAMPPNAHLAMQAAFQRHVDNAVSKTVALAKEATPGDVQRVYRRAWRLGLKGVTVFRVGSRRDEVIRLGLGDG